jgi:hypothetical protein
MQLDKKIDDKFNILDSKIDQINQKITNFLIGQSKKWTEEVLPHLGVNLNCIPSWTHNTNL